MLTASDYYDRLASIALSVFEWTGLPESCNQRFLERALYETGRAVFVNDPIYGYLTLECTPSGQLNIYNEPVSYTAFSTRYHKDFKRTECVYIRNNYLERPTIDSIILFANRLTEAERTIDINIKAQKTPVVIRCSEKEKLTMMNAFKQFTGNEPLILYSDAMNIDNFKVLKTDAPFVADKVQEYKRNIWNDCMTFLGINNNYSEDKKERLLTDEINANNDQININAQTMLLTRKIACEEINKMYGLNVDVKMRTFNESEAEYGEVYDGTRETD